MQRVICLDIGSYSIKVLEFVNTIKNYELIDFYENVIPHIEDSETSNVTPSVVEQLFNEYHLQADRILTAMPGQFISSRILKLGYSDPKKIKVAVTSEVEDAVPFSLDDMIVDHQVLASVGNLTHTLAVMTKKSFLSNFLDLLQRVNIDPKSVDVDSLAFYNLCNFIHPEDDSCVAMIDIGHEKTSICIVKDGLLRLFRSINVGGKYVTEFLSRDMELTYYDAERLKHKVSRVILPDQKNDDLSKEERMVAEKMGFGVNAIVKELGRTLYAFKSLERSPLNKIYLSGGTSRIKGIDKVLSEQLEADVVRFSECAGSIDVAENLSPDFDVMAQSIAIGMRSIGANKKQSRINLRQGDFAYVQDYQSVFKFARAFVRVSAVIMVLLFASYFVKHFIYSRYLDRAKEDYLKVYASVMQEKAPKAKSFKALISKVESNVKRKSAEVEQAMQKIKESTKGSGALILLQKMSESIPKSVEVDVVLYEYKAIDETKASVKFSAETSGYDKQAEFIEALKKVPDLIEVVEKSSNQKPGTDGKIISFTIQATHERSL